MNPERLAAIKFLFGVSENSLEDFVEENLKQIEELMNLLVAEASNKAVSERHPSSDQVFIIALLPLLLIDEEFLLFVFNSLSWVFRSRRLQTYYFFYCKNPLARERWMLKLQVVTLHYLLLQFLQGYINLRTEVWS